MKRRRKKRRSACALRCVPRGACGGARGRRPAVRFATLQRVAGAALASAELKHKARRVAVLPWWRRWRLKWERQVAVRAQVKERKEAAAEKLWTLDVARGLEPSFLSLTLGRGGGGGGGVQRQLQLRPQEALDVVPYSTATAATATPRKQQQRGRLVCVSDGDGDDDGRRKRGFQLQQRQQQEPAAETRVKKHKNQHRPQQQRALAVSERAAADEVVVANELSALSLIQHSQQRKQQQQRRRADTPASPRGNHRGDEVTPSFPSVLRSTSNAEVAWAVLAAEKARAESSRLVQQRHGGAGLNGVAESDAGEHSSSDEDDGEEDWYHDDSDGESVAGYSVAAPVVALSYADALSSGSSRSVDGGGCGGGNKAAQQSPHSHMEALQRAIESGL